MDSRTKSKAAGLFVAASTLLCGVTCAGPTGDLSQNIAMPSALPQPARPPQPSRPPEFPNVTLLVTRAHGRNANTPYILASLGSPRASRPARNNATSAPKLTDTPTEPIGGGAIVDLGGGNGATIDLGDDDRGDEGNGIGGLGGGSNTIGLGSVGRLGGDGGDTGTIDLGGDDADSGTIDLDGDDGGANAIDLGGDDGSTDAIDLGSDDGGANAIDLGSDDGGSSTIDLRGDDGDTNAVNVSGDAALGAQDGSNNSDSASGDGIDGSRSDKPAQPRPENSRSDILQKLDSLPEGDSDEEEEFVVSCKRMVRKTYESDHDDPAILLSLQAKLAGGGVLKRLQPVWKPVLNAAVRRVERLQANAFALRKLRGAFRNSEWDENEGIFRGVDSTTCQTALSNIIQKDAGAKRLLINIKTVGRHSLKRLGKLCGKSRSGSTARSEFPAIKGSARTRRLVQKMFEKRFRGVSARKVTLLGGWIKTRSGHKMRAVVGLKRRGGACAMQTVSLTKRNGRKSKPQCCTIEKTEPIACDVLD